MKKETGIFIGIVLFLILITTKLWIKATFEIQLVGFILLFVLSFYLKKVIMRTLKKRINRSNNHSNHGAPR